MEINVLTINDGALRFVDKDPVSTYIDLLFKCYISVDYDSLQQRFTKH